MNKDTTLRILRILLCISFVFILSSCRVSDKIPNSPWDSDVHFLWFIPVSSEATIILCALALAAHILIGAFARLGNLEGPGWHTEDEEIQENIYDNLGKKVGSYVTGHRRHRYYISEEEYADGVVWWERAKKYVRITAFVVSAWGMVISWLFPFYRFWFWLFFIPICGFRLLYWYSHLESADTLLKWEKVFMIVCIICIIVYSFYV